MRIVALTGAGISAESGISTFRDSGGLWEGYAIEEVASPQGWIKNPAVVLDFYNQRRKIALNAEPNEGHLALARLERLFELTIITQNVDNLHEKAGSSQVIHLHGELFKSRSTKDSQLIYDIEGWELKLGDKCEKGAQLRPHIVWFGEPVPLLEKAIAATRIADIFMVIGTSLQVYPAAGLMNYVKASVPKYIIDPNLPPVAKNDALFLVPEKASIGLPKVAAQLLQENA